MAITPFIIEWCKSCICRFDCPLSEVEYIHFKGRSAAIDLRTREQYLMDIIKSNLDFVKAWKILGGPSGMACVKEHTPFGITFYRKELTQFAMDKKLWKEQSENADEY